MKEKINQLIIEKTKSRDIDTLEVLKLIKTEFTKAEKSGKPWNPVKTMLGMIAAREDSRSQYLAAGRKDLATKEDYEIEVINSLLPDLPSEEKMKESVIEYLKGLNRPVSPKDIKPTLAALSPSYPGLTGRLVSEIIKILQC